MTTYHDWYIVHFMTELLLTIRQAVKHVFPQINDATIHSWMAKGVFHPYIYVPPPTGPGRGCQLNMSDLVTIGVIHSLLKFGLKFNDLTDSVLDFIDPVRKGQLTSFADIAKSMVTAHKSGRRIQAFLQKYEYKVWVAWSPIIFGSIYYYKNNHVTFFPHDSDLPSVASLSGDDVSIFEGVIKEMKDTSTPTLGNLLINCETWLEHVQAQMGLI